MLALINFDTKKTIHLKVSAIKMVEQMDGYTIVTLEKPIKIAEKAIEIIRLIELSHPSQ